MTAAIRRFTTHWKPWAIRWTDPRQPPTCAPFFVADCGKAGYFVGPYLSEQGEIRDELVRYKDFEAARLELKLKPADFLAASVWAKQLEPLGAIAKAVAAWTVEATKVLAALPPNRKERDERVREYLHGAVHTLKLALEAYRAYHAGDEPKPIPDVPVIPRSAEGLSDLYRARLAERDRRVSSAATARLVEMAGAARGRLVGPERQG